MQSYVYCSKCITASPQLSAQYPHPLSRIRIDKIDLRIEFRPLIVVAPFVGTWY